MESEEEEEEGRLFQNFYFLYDKFFYHPTRLELSNLLENKKNFISTETEKIVDSLKKDNGLPSRSGSWPEQQPEPESIS